MIFSTRARDGRLAELESLRGAAAVYVLLFHALIPMLQPYGYLATAPFRFGQEAVMLFFVISGFAVHLSVKKRPKFELRRYVAHRVLRIYPILLVALALAWITLSAAEGRPLVPDWPNLLGNLALQQDENTSIPAFMGDAPLWSLSYEWAYYTAYAVAACLLPERLRGAAFMAMSILAASSLLWTGPSHVGHVALYGLVWWAGVALCDVHLGAPLRRLWAPLGSIGLAILALIAWWKSHGVIRSPIGDGIGGAYPIREIRNLLAGFLAVIVIVIWSRLKWRGFVIRPLAAFASISYAVYVIHVPLMVTLRRAFPGVNSWVWFAAAGAVTLALAYILEFRFQPLVVRLVGRRAHSPAIDRQDESAMKAPV